MLHKKSILGVAITDASAENILEYLFEMLDKPHAKLQIVTPNPEIIVYANRHKSFQDILNRADISLCDGIGLFLAAKLLNEPIKERIAGADFVEMVCKKAVNESKKDVRKPVIVGFLGGKKNVAKRTAECLRKKYPGLVVGFAGAEWPDIESAKFKVQSTNTIDILFVAYGFPKQEEWIATHLSHIPVKAAMGVGGTFDYLSGSIPRAPFFIRAVGLEWLFRLIRQPWRLVRQVALVEFMISVIREKIRQSK
jgi:N-acetylglucosaminyldiphosphoundecaprenol N-acetyl-beta-D-mannosaminyltransferase